MLQRNLALNINIQHFSPAEWYIDNSQLTWAGMSTNEQADRCVKVRSTATTNLHEG